MNELFGPIWIAEFDERLAEDGSLQNALALFEGDIRLTNGLQNMHVGAGIERVAARSLPDDAGYRFGLSGSPDAWEHLMSFAGANLNLSVRRGELSLIGDRASLMKWWKPVFLVSELAREMSR